MREPAGVVSGRDALSGLLTAFRPELDWRIAQQFVIVEGRDAGIQFEVDRTVVLGRDPSAGVVLADEEVSRRHASLTLEGGRVLVEDLGSTNGTFVNGQLLKEPRGLEAGDKIRIGRTILQVSVPATRVASTMGYTTSGGSADSEEAPSSAESGAEEAPPGPMRSPAQSAVTESLDASPPIRVPPSRSDPGGMRYEPSRARARDQLVAHPQPPMEPPPPGLWQQAQAGGGRPRTVLGVVSLLVGAVVLVLAIGAHVYASEHKPTFENVLSHGGDVLSRHSYDALRAFAWVATVGGIVALISGLVLLISRPAAAGPVVPSTPPPPTTAQPPSGPPESPEQSIR